MVLSIASGCNGEHSLLQALADHADERRGRLFGQRDADVPCALHRVAALRLASVSSTGSLVP